MINDRIIACVKFNSLKKLLLFIIFNNFLRALHYKELLYKIYGNLIFQEIFLISVRVTHSFFYYSSSSSPESESPPPDESESPPPGESESPPPDELESLDGALELESLDGADPPSALGADPPSALGAALGAGALIVAGFTV